MNAKEIPTFDNYVDFSKISAGGVVAISCVDGIVHFSRPILAMFCNNNSTLINTKHTVEDVNILLNGILCTNLIDNKFSSSPTVTSSVVNLCHEIGWKARLHLNQEDISQLIYENADIVKFTKPKKLARALESLVDSGFASLNLLKYTDNLYLASKIIIKWYDPKSKVSAQDFTKIAKYLLKVEIVPDVVLIYDLTGILLKMGEFAETLAVVKHLMI